VNNEKDNDSRDYYCVFAYGSGWLNLVYSNYAQLFPGDVVERTV